MPNQSLKLAPGPIVSDSTRTRKWIHALRAFAAVAWAARVARTCRCKRELRVFKFDPQS